MGQGTSGCLDLAVGDKPKADGSKGTCFEREGAGDRCAARGMYRWNKIALLIDLISAWLSASAGQPHGYHAGHG